MRAGRVILISAAAFSCGAGAQVLDVSAPPPRDFGYLTGDVLTRHVQITLAPGTVLDRSTLPQAGPAGAALDLRSVTVRDGGIDLEYQTFASPEQVARVDVPGFSLMSGSHAKRFSTRIAGFSFTVSPFRHDLQPVIDPRAMRPDHDPVPAEETGLQPGLALSMGLALASLSVMVARTVFRGLPGRRELPFAGASRAIARTPGNARENFLTLHRAFDAALGERFLIADVDRFVGRHAVWTPLRNDIAAFFAASNAMFFTARQAADFDTVRLARLLARAERRG